MNAESLQMNVGFIGDFLYPIIAPQTNSVISGSRVAGADFLRALIEYGSCHCTFFVSPKYDIAIEKDVRDFFDKYYTIEFENYPVQLEHYLPRPQEVK